MIKNWGQLITPVKQLKVQGVSKFASPKEKLQESLVESLPYIAAIREKNEFIYTNSQTK